MRYAIVIENAGPNFSAYVPDLPGCVATGATLEEVAEAALILHVIDVSSIDAHVHVKEVFRILEEIGASATPQILVLNKSDRLGTAEADARVLAARLLSDAGHETPVPAVLVSGLTGAGVADLFAQIDRVLAFDTVETVTFLVPLSEAGVISTLHEHGKVLQKDYDGDSCRMVVEAPESLRRRLKRFRLEMSPEPVENSVQK